jgi:hypothetical protein
VARRTFAERFLGLLLVLVSLSLVLVASRYTVYAADYEVILGPYPGLGPNGGRVQDQGVSQLDPLGAMDTWNSWTGTNKLSWSTECGRCIIFVNEGATLTWTDCTMNTLPDSGSGFAIAAAFMIAGDSIWTNPADPDCKKYGSLSNPIYVVVLNSSLGSFDSSARLHIARHEMAHALGLDDTGQACWVEQTWIVYPLMHNSFPANNCHDSQGNPWRYKVGSTYTLLNYWATNHEKQAAKTQNQW